MRVVLDTNIIVSATISEHGYPAAILRAWDDERFQLLISPALLAEYRQSLGYRRVRQRHGMNDEELNELVAEYRKGGLLIEPTDTLTVVVGDPDDNRVLECAVAGEATHIVSGDSHLLDLTRYQEVPILTPREFVAHLMAGDEQ